MKGGDIKMKPTLCALLFIEFCRENGFQLDLDFETMLKHITLTNAQRIELKLIQSLDVIE